MDSFLHKIWNCGVFYSPHIELLHGTEKRSPLDVGTCHSVFPTITDTTLGIWGRSGGGGAQMAKMDVLPKYIYDCNSSAHGKYIYDWKVSRDCKSAKDSIILTDTTVSWGEIRENLEISLQQKYFQGTFSADSQVVIWFFPVGLDGH